MQKFSAFKQRLTDRKQHPADKLVCFEKETHGGFAQVAEAIKDLFV